MVDGDYRGIHGYIRGYILWDVLCRGVVFLWTLDPGLVPLALAVIRCGFRRLAPAHRLLLPSRSCFEILNTRYRTNCVHGKVVCLVSYGSRIWR